MDFRVEQRLQRRREAQVGLLVERTVVLAESAGAHVHTRFIRMLEVGVFEVELAEAVVLAVAVEVAG